MVKIGVLGAGHLGKIHLSIIKQLPQFGLVGFYDADPLTAKKIANELNVKPYASIDELIEDCDAIDIVTPTITHFECASKALKKTRHVFIEKPLTHTLKEAKKLLTLANEANVKIQVGHVERFNPAFLTAAPYISEPLFIETHRLAQFNPRGTDVSVVLDLMIHDIDIVLSIVKANIKRVSASGVAVVSDTPDITNARIEFDNGCVANLTSSRISLKNMRKTRFFQKDAYISVDFLDKKVEMVRLKPVMGDVDPLAITIDLGKNKGMKQIFFENKTAEPNNAIKLELEAFANAILNNTSTPVPIEDGYKALDVAHLIIDKIKLSSVTEDINNGQ
ncbi:MAG: Gfo/Idh/MocA family oxidoreductase [Bacteroidetes bacterium]|nr:Gfo/Idh/MocA family oxidoreductase [Bacteroidota bacterium]